MRGGAEVARRAHNPKVISSNLVPATTKALNFIFRAFFIKREMFTVYVLYSEAHNKIYIGFTSNMEQRLLSHNELGTKGYTKRYRPWVVAHTEQYTDKGSAMKREKELKSSRGRNWIWGMLSDRGLISVS